MRFDRWDAFCLPQGVPKDGKVLGGVDTPRGRV